MCSKMENEAVLIFLLCVFSVTSAQDLTNKFHFVNVNLSWTEAQQFCREHYTDLATVSNTEDMNRLLRPASYTGDAWIGLTLNVTGVYHHWKPGNTQSDECPEIWDDEYWYDYDCAEEQCFVCYRDSSPKHFVLNTTLRTWAEAQESCRAHYTDLALIENEAENNEVALLVSDCEYAWIRRQREVWKWSDQSRVQFSNWMDEYPQYLNSSQCTVEDQSHYWKDVNCDLRIPFFCYKLEKKTVVKVSFRSDLDMSDPKNYKTIIQKLEEKINQPGVKVTWKTAPKKKTSTKQKGVNCPKL